MKRKSFNCQCGSPDCRYSGDRQELEDEEPEPEPITVDEALDAIDDDVYDDEMEDNGEDIDEAEDWYNDSSGENFVDEMCLLYTDVWMMGNGDDESKDGEDYGKMEDVCEDVDEMEDHWLGCWQNWRRLLGSWWNRRRCEDVDEMKDECGDVDEMEDDCEDVNEVEGWYKSLNCEKKNFVPGKEMHEWQYLLTILYNDETKVRILSRVTTMTIPAQIPGQWWNGWLRILVKVCEFYKNYKYVVICHDWALTKLTCKQWFIFKTVGHSFVGIRLYYNIMWTDIIRQHEMNFGQS